MAEAVFGASLPGAVAYADLLAREATLRGLIGPREVPRLWERHLLNCAVLSDLIPRGATVCDLGSGAGLPGIPLALRRPDLQITLLEPLLRRSRFLEEVVTALELRQVQVHRGRAEELAGAGSFEVVTSRAVAPLDRLARWSLPLTRSGGLVLAMKGSTAHDEVKAARRVLRRLGAGEPEVLTVGGELLADPSTVVRVIKA